MREVAVHWWETAHCGGGSAFIIPGRICASYYWPLSLRESTGTCAAKSTGPSTVLPPSPLGTVLASARLGFRLSTRVGALAFLGFLCFVWLPQLRYQTCNSIARTYRASATFVGICPFGWGATVASSHIQKQSHTRHRRTLASSLADPGRDIDSLFHAEYWAALHGLPSRIFPFRTSKLRRDMPVAGRRMGGSNVLISPPVDPPVDGNQAPGPAPTQLGHVRHTEPPTAPIYSYSHTQAPLATVSNPL